MDEKQMLEFEAWKQSRPHEHAIWLKLQTTADVLYMDVGEVTNVRLLVSNLATWLWNWYMEGA